MGQWWARGAQLGWLCEHPAECQRTGKGQGAELRGCPREGAVGGRWGSHHRPLMTGKEGRGAVVGDRVCSAAQGHHGQKGSGQPTEDGKTGGLWGISKPTAVYISAGRIHIRCQEGRAWWQEVFRGCRRSHRAVWSAAGSEARALSRCLYLNPAEQPQGSRQMSLPQHGAGDVENRKMTLAADEMAFGEGTDGGWEL